MPTAKLTSGRSATRATSYTTNALGAAENKLIVAWVLNVSVQAGNPPAPTATAIGVNLEQVGSVLIPAPGTIDRRLTCFRAVGGATSVGAVTFEFSSLQQRCAWSIVAYDDFDRSGVDGAGAITQIKTATAAGETLSLSLATLGEPTRSIVASAVMLRGSKDIVPGANLAELDEQMFAVATPGTLETADRIGGGETVSWSWQGDEAAAAIAIEIKRTPIEPPVGDDTEALAHKFEPIIFFHETEVFFPVDAKRYVEHCALWKAEAPFDDKRVWGGSIGLPFDRQPLIKGNQIAARDGEPGRRLDPSVWGSDGSECFLEFGGWRNADGPEPAVTATSRNTFANRFPIFDAYNNPESEGGIPALGDSKFWYHAEFFHNAHLRELLRSVPAPDLVKVLETLKNAALLNYYFFFPVHVEPLSGCTNIEGREFASFVGEWQCFSLLLERETPTAEFNPTFVGVTGRFITDLPARTVQELDLDDPAQRISMRVSPASMMDMTNGHPNLFAANGSHTLYLRSGTITAITYPDGLAPFGCGRFEGPVPEPPGPQQSEAETFLWKITAGALLGGPLGAIVGLIWALFEAATASLGTHSLPQLHDDPVDDQTGQPGTGKVVKPTTVNIPNPGAELHDWKSRQGLVISGRRYDFLVDRASQLWWPPQNNLDNTQGYPGRWGPRVEHDQFARRAGMRLPRFWRLFFLALARGKSTQVF